MCISTNISVHKPITLPHAIAKLGAVCEQASKAARKHLVVQHNYHDHSDDIAPTGIATEVLSDDLNHNAFPLKLYEMLLNVERDGVGDIVSWQPHGRCFVVHKPDEFKNILPRYFKLSKVASFQRQLNLYGFMRLTRGLDKGGYYHELFLRGRAYLAQKIQRVKVKGTGVRAKSNPGQEPDFWNMPWVTPNPPCTTMTFENDNVATVPMITKSKQVTEEVCCSTSVVSRDEEEPPQPQRIALHEQPMPVTQPIQVNQPMAVNQPMQVSQPMPVTSFSLCPQEWEPQEDTLVTSWGMPFYYLSRPNTPQADPDPQFSAPAAVPSSSALRSSRNYDEGMDQVLGSIDFDEVVHDLLKGAEGMSFADMLERAVQ